jgi:sugar phosphate isomerase/epimerase
MIPAGYQEALDFASPFFGRGRTGEIGRSDFLQRGPLLPCSGDVGISTAPLDASATNFFFCTEGAVYVACSTLCFARFSLDETLRKIAELEFNKFDLTISEAGPHVRPSEVAADVLAAAQKIRIGPSLAPTAFNVDIQAPSEEEFLRQLRAICQLARLCTVSVLTLPAASSGTGLDLEIKRLKAMTHLVAAEGITLTLETRTGTLTEHPDTAVELCKRVPGLGLTLDPSHYIAGPHQGKSFDQVYPYVRHVHLRDTGRGQDQFQVRVGQGEIEYGRIISHLAREGYDRLLTVEIYDIPDAPFAMDIEVRKLKYLLESLI